MNLKAFTLIELLVVISILGILAAVVLVSLQGAQDQAEIGRGKEFSHTVRVSLGADLVGEWRLDEGSGTEAEDSSGYDNHGTLGGFNGTASSGWTEGVFGKALAFTSGDDNNVALASSNSIISNNNSWTMSMWFKASSIGAGDYANRIITFQRTTGDSTGISLLLGQDTKARAMYADGGGAHRYIDVENNIQLNKWYNFVFIYNGIKYTAYLNGENSGERTDSFQGLSTGIARIGCFTTSQYVFDGIIDDVQIYNQALSTTEVQQLYAQRTAEHGIALK